MLQFGFYSNLEEIVDIIRGILLIFNGLFDVTNHQEEEYFRHPGKFAKDKLPNQKANTAEITNHGEYYRLRTRYLDNEEN